MQSFHDTLGKGSLPNFVTKAVATATPSLLYPQAGLADRRQASYGHTHLHMGTLIFVCTVHWSPWALWTQYRDRIPSGASEKVIR